jgi:hypothetical protein
LREAGGGVKRWRRRNVLPERPTRTKIISARVECEDSAVELWKKIPAIGLNKRGDRVPVTVVKTAVTGN